jgi:hypothetical protein
MTIKEESFDVDGNTRKWRSGIGIQAGHPLQIHIKNQYKEKKQPAGRNLAQGGGTYSYRKNRNPFPFSAALFYYRTPAGRFFSGK